MQYTYSFLVNWMSFFYKTSLDSDSMLLRKNRWGFFQLLHKYENKFFTVLKFKYLKLQNIMYKLLRCKIKGQGVVTLQSRTSLKNWCNFSNFRSSLDLCDLRQYLSIITNQISVISWGRRKSKTFCNKLNNYVCQEKKRNFRS